MSTAKTYNDLFYVRDHQVDIIFLIDASKSLNEKIKIASPTGVKMFRKIDVINDVIKKIATLHDCDVAPGTKNFGFDSIQAPSIDHVNKVPPWGTKPDGTSMSQAELEAMPIGYLRRFNIKIESQKVNIGVIKISSEEDTEILSSLMNYPDCFDRHYLFEKIKNGFGSSKEQNYLHATRLALYELFFGPRSKQVLKRFLFYIGDGFAPSSKEAINLLNMAQPERPLAIRRPLDIDLKGDFIIGDEKKPVRYNGANKSEWYTQPCSVVSLFAGIGSKSKGVSRKAKEYVFDYSKFPGNPMGYLDISSERPAKQFNRIIGIINVVERLTYDNGFENVFSITLHNCGPHEVKLLNTIINFENDTEDTPEEDRPKPYVGATKYTTEFLKSGIPKGNDFFDIQTMTAGESSGFGEIRAGVEGEEETGWIADRDPVENVELVFEATSKDDPDDIIGGRNNNFIPGRGGQYYADPENADLLEDTDSNYNILWHSFNTQYEIYRRGKIYNIDGGWASHWRESKGVKNDGVAFKGMPVRVFKSESTGFEIIDYNIGNAVESNGYMGDYSHLPTIERGQEIDLFFGVRVGESLDVSQDLVTYDALLERVQLFINAEDKTLNKMACFANLDFNLVCPIFRPSKQTFDKGYDLFVPFEDGAVFAPPFDDVDNGQTDMPMAGTWEIKFDDASYVDGTAYIRIEIPEVADAAEILEDETLPDGTLTKKLVGYDENKLICGVVAQTNINLGETDNSSLVDALEDSITDQASGITGNLSASAKTARDAYAAPVGGTLVSGMQYAGVFISYNKTTQELYIICSARCGASGNTPPPPNYDIDGTAVVYTANVGGQTQSMNVPDASYSTLQFMFKIDPETEDTKTGDGNDFIKALGAGGHGEWYPVQGTWVDLVVPDVMPTQDDPAQGTKWVGTNSKSVTITKL